MNEPAPRPAVGPLGPAAPASVGWSWLIRWRWLVGGISGVALLAVARWDHEATPTLPLALLLAVLLGSNAVLAKGKPRGGDAALFGILGFDTLVLTAFLALTGGATNPFSILYMVQITLAAVVLGSRWTWPIVALSVVCFGALFALPTTDFAAVESATDHLHHDHGHHGGFSRHLYGMLAAFAVTSAAVTYLVTRIARALRARETELVEAREQAARAEHMAALTTLAAGAAHELGTPLGTIAIAASELARDAARVAPDLAADAQLIRAEVGRCRAILDQMNTSAAEAGGEPASRVSVAEVMGRVAALQPDDRRSRLRCVDEAGGEVSLPPNRTVRVLGDLVDNAFDASGPRHEVTLEARRAGGAVSFAVQDGGVGMDPVVLRRAREPFFTTKDAGEGMGLGLFLAQALADRLGGRLEIASRPGAGTTTALHLPVSAAPEEWVS
ncbi:MAG: ATP-binding protein [Myxococcota bacterium]